MEITSTGARAVRSCEVLGSATASIQPAVDARALAVEAAIDVLAASIEAAVDAVALAVEALGAQLAAVRFGGVSASIEAAVDAIALAIETLFDAIPLLVEVLLDRVAVIGEGGTGEEEAGEGCGGQVKRLHGGLLGLVGLVGMVSNSMPPSTRRLAAGCAACG
ncbi:MAG: hypothetical protein FJ091_17450 [Deltaproteobacteria bacterium]|nr:hypothetical protein [Deltaproteobacteria bacterium]